MIEINMTPKERQSQKHKLGNIKGLVHKANKVLDAAYKVAKKTGQMWEWRVDNLQDDLMKLITTLENEEKRLSK